MKKFTPLLFKLLILVVLVVVIFGFFYFETSWLLRILTILLGLIGFWQMSKLPEVLILVILYLSLYDLYNIRYGLAVPMAPILLSLLAISSFLFYAQTRLGKFGPLEKNLFYTYLLAIDLIVLEIFLGMSLWPVDPKTKSLVITLVFYLIGKVIYLNSQNMLNLKRIAGFLVATIVVLGIVLALGWWFGF